MKIFIAIKYDEQFLELIPGIRNAVEKLGHTTYCFATDEPYIADEKEMMRSAFEKIDQTDVLLLEVSEMAFGVGIEAGYAFARNKKIITIANESQKISRTLKGISASTLVYKDLNDLEIKLQEVL